MNRHHEERQGRRMTRRALLMVGATGIMLGAARVTHAARHTDEEGVTAPEDLMKEHGVLNRCLLVYEEGMRRLQVGPQVFHQKPPTWCAALSKPTMSGMKKSISSLSFRRPGN
jgi:hypothetical protein